MIFAYKNKIQKSGARFTNRHFFKNSAGFTLIELLVVIAIIALLSTIVLVSVNYARNKAKDKAIMQELSHIRTVATMIYVDETAGIGGSYAHLCDASNTLNHSSTYYPRLANVEALVGSLNGGTDPTCYATATSWCVRSVLASGGNFCVDAKGLASTVTTVCDGTPAGAPVCH